MEYVFQYRLRVKKRLDHADIVSSLGLRAEFDFPNSKKDDDNNWHYFILDPKKKIVVRESILGSGDGLVELTEEAYQAGLWDL